MDAARRTSVTPESFGERLRQLRSAAGISQDELARRSGLSTAAVGALERGTRRAPKQDTFKLLAEALALAESAWTDLALAAERGRARSSRPRSLIAETAHNLPLQLTSFIGREDEIAQIARLINSNRLVTVFGSGGVGKTRAALELATRMVESSDEEVRFVELAPLQDGTFIVGRIASVLEVRLSDGSETPESLARALKARRALLLLDNCEHLIADVTRIVRIVLQQCPHIRIIATTRERLGIMGEVVYRLPPLAIPDDDIATIADGRSSSALELLVQRGQSADPDFTCTDQQTHVLIDICRRLEGIPLAIELAAAQLPTLGVETLSRRLEAALGASRGVRGVPDRHQTMRNTLAWSCNLLIEPERMLLRRLGVFAGGCTLAAAESVCPEGDLQASDVAGLLASLVDKSLVNAVIDGETMRYMLLDSTRTFAREQLGEAGEEPAISRRHAQWLAAHGLDAVRAYLSKPNLIWLEEFSPELDNVRSALEWALQAEVDEALLAGSIAGSFRGLWLVSGRYNECRRWIELIVGRLDETQEPLVVANLLTALMQTLAGPEQITVLEHLIALVRRLGDHGRLGVLLLNVAVRYAIYGALDKAQQSVDEAVQILGEEGLLETNFGAFIPLARGNINAARGQFADARAELERGWAFAKQSDDQYMLVNISTKRAEIEFLAGDFALAAKYAESAVERANTIPHGLALKAGALCWDAAIRLNTSGIDGSDVAALQAFSAANLVGDSYFRLISLQNLAAVAARRGRPQMSGRLLGSIEAWIDSTGYVRTPFEEATYKLLVASLRSQLGDDAETHIAEGRGLNLDDAADEVLLSDFHDSVEMNT